jgi:thiol-disulfide isomerase/thioredoxin
LIALLAILVLLALTPSKALAHGDDHPADLRNARNQFTHLRPLRTAPSVPILAQDGSRLDLGRFRGRLILVNLWATWCPPCLYELPALDRLQALLGSDAFAVVALSIDEGDISGLVSFVNRLGLRNLAIYQDITRRAQDTLPLYGLPITYLIDSDGLVLGYIVGATEWDSPEALEFLRHYIRVSPAASSSRQGSGGLSGKAAVQGATRTLQGTGGS